jgi:hypothetical protein
LAEAFALFSSLCSDDGLAGGFLLEWIFGVDGRSDSFEACSVGVAFGLGVSGGGAAPVEAGVDGAAATFAPSGLIIGEAAAAAALFGVSVGGADPVESGADGAVATFAASGLTVGEGAAALFGVSAGGAAPVEAGVDGAAATFAPSGLTVGEASGVAALSGVSVGGAAPVEAGVDALAIGAPSGPILSAGASAGAWSGVAGVNTGGGDSKPKEARFGASTSAAS